MGSGRRVGLGVVLGAAALLTAAPTRAADLYVAAGTNLQTAIDRAQPGDRLLLAPGATFTGNFRLPNKGTATTYITIRSAAADTLLPLAGVRIRPADAPHLPILQSPNTAPALTVAAGAHHWRLQYLEFRANLRGFGEILALGAGDLRQTLLTQVPHHFVLAHLYIHGDPALGQKRGIALHSGATWVTDSYIADIKGVGMDTQAINGYNGPGPYTIVNNYLEAAGENFMLGGASPKIPNLIPADIEFTGNHLYKPLAWRTPIVPTPTGVTAVAGGSGSLPAGTYAYRVLAARRTAQDAWAYSARAAEVTAGVGAGGRVTVSWAPVAGATTYRVYRGPAPGAQDRYFGTAATSFVDDGTAAGVADTGTWATGTRWAVKNLFELKLGQRVRVHGNLMEHAWQESQTGFAVLLTPRNQDATSPWIAVRDVTFTGNLVRHAGSGVQIEGYDTNATSGQTRRITIAQNIFDDISASAWGGSGRWIQIGNRPSDLTIDHNTVLHDGQAIYVYGGSYGAEMTVANLRFTNNLLKHNTYGIMGNARAYGTDTLTAYFPGALVQRNTFAGGSAARYPAGNEFPTVAFWQGQFVDVTASNFSLIASSRYRASGTDASRSRRAGGAGRGRRADGAPGPPGGAAAGGHRHDGAPRRADGGGVCGHPPGDRRVRHLWLAGHRRRAARGAVARGGDGRPPRDPGPVRHLPDHRAGAGRGRPRQRGRAGLCPEDCVDPARRLAGVADPGGDPRGPDRGARRRGDRRRWHGDAGRLLRECDHPRRRVGRALVDHLGPRRPRHVPPHGRGDGQ